MIFVGQNQIRRAFRYLWGFLIWQNGKNWIVHVIEESHDTQWGGWVGKLLYSSGETAEEILMLYKSQESLYGYDEKIDNIKLSAEEVAIELHQPPWNSS